MTTTKSFLSLPIEIHLEVIDCLDYPARFALAYANKYFNQIVTRRVPPPTNEEKLAYLCATETWPVYRDYLACNQCLKFRPTNAFTNKQHQGKRSRGYSDNKRRFCIRCGVHKHIYQPGHVIPIDNDSKFVICWCCKFPGSGSYCLVFGSCANCGQVMPVMHYIWDQIYQPCLHSFNCFGCGQEGSVSRLHRPLQGRLDDILHQYRAISVSVWKPKVHSPS
ncbi:hypothetical protein BGW36DRAFT_297859 [Talaromyces proteolyticus]|uniref:F-box domain-containing protein n=1 Tax=Talaromyces proteolyticus TaxID=1131652 RepID=A0AAD4PZ19_9EURO|nr:uncharacterized protein BGW36DRAFT_297859 [Talaromyces proteolyticus]KAH8695962.1 hypothetical protein BGW36DRAFT_297859 [Talaromyces proteolyticus]